MLVLEMARSAGHERRARETQTLRVARLTFFAAVAAVIVEILWIAVALLH
jgi:hypothetical protein